MGEVRRQGWVCCGSRLWVNIERSVTEAQAQRPAAQAQWALRTTFPHVAGEWVVERASRRVYDEHDDIQGHLVGDELHMTAGGPAKLGGTQADFAAKIAAAATR